MIEKFPELSGTRGAWRKTLFPECVGNWEWSKWPKKFLDLWMSTKECIEKENRVGWVKTRKREGKKKKQQPKPNTMVKARML